MALKKEVHVKIEGNFVKGKIVGDIFRTNILAHVPTIETHSSVGIRELKLVIGELQELAEMLESIDVADKLTK